MHVSAHNKAGLEKIFTSAHYKAGLEKICTSEHNKVGLERTCTSAHYKAGLERRWEAQLLQHSQSLPGYRSENMWWITRKYEWYRRRIQFATAAEEKLGLYPFICKKAEAALPRLRTLSVKKYLTGSLIILAGGLLQLFISSWWQRWQRWRWKIFVLGESTVDL